jgi:FkbM family methyltransferase
VRISWAHLGTRAENCTDGAMIVHRVQLLIRRFLRARKFGISFTGTSGFVLPSRIDLCDRTVELSHSGKPETGLDFINVALDDEYGLNSLPFEPRTILDVGANVGLFSLMARHYFRSAVIHAYEPNPRTFPFAAKNLARIDAVGFQAGLGSRAGFAEMCDNVDSRQAQTHLIEKGSVRIDSLQQAIERLNGSVDLMKLDCEGAEWDLFSDLESFRKVRVIRMEYHLTEGRTLDDFRAAIQKLGFVIDRLEPNQGFGVAWMSRQN